MYGACLSSISSRYIMSHCGSTVRSISSKMPVTIRLVVPLSIVISSVLPMALPSGNHLSANDCEIMTELMVSSTLFLSPTAMGMGMRDMKLESTHRAFWGMVSSPMVTLCSIPLRDLRPIRRHMASMSG